MVICSFEFSLPSAPKDELILALFQTKKKDELINTFGQWLVIFSYHLGLTVVCTNDKLRAKLHLSPSDLSPDLLKILTWFWPGAAFKVRSSNFDQMQPSWSQVEGGLNNCVLLWGLRRFITWCSNFFLCFISEFIILYVLGGFIIWCWIVLCFLDKFLTCISFYVCFADGFVVWCSKLQSFLQWTIRLKT
jgi:hypothetical protein